MTSRRSSSSHGPDPNADDSGSDLDHLDDGNETDEDNGAAHADVGATIACPYCGAPNEIALDPSGGRRQDYVEDCQVCCQPWNVRIQYRRDGTANVEVDAADAD